MERKESETANENDMTYIVEKSGLSDSQIDRINSTIEKARGMITTMRDATGGSN